MKLIGGPYCGGHIGTQLIDYDEETRQQIIVHPPLTVELLQKLYVFNPINAAYYFKNYSWSK